MKVLVAEDNKQKIQRLIDLLTTECGLLRENVDTATTISDARSRLRVEQYDLFILDIVLPLRAEDEPTKKGASDLLEELSTRNTFRRPARIIGLTAYEDAIAEVGPLFASRVWTVIKFDFASDNWATQIRNCVTYMLGQTTQQQRIEYKTDLCIVTALPTPELEALLKMGWNWSAAEPLDDTAFVRRTFFTSGDKSYSAVAAAAPRMGMVAAALLASRLVERERPRYLVIAGLCAGVQGKTNFGDIVLGDPCWDWQNGKHVDDGLMHKFAIAPEQYPVASYVRVRADQLRSDAALWSSVKQNWPNAPDTELKLRIGPMASGSAVLADQDMLESVIRQQRNLLAVEMEAYGVYAAGASACFPRPTTFALKSVCDYADGEKNDQWQSYAAYTSAQAVRIFFERYMTEIVDLAGSI